MEDGTILGWINANGAVVGAVSAAVGFVFGFRSNLWLHRRQEWNATVGRARAPPERLWQANPLEA